MTRKIVLTVTLPYGAYHDFDRAVEYEVNDTIKQRYDSETINEMLYEAIEQNYNEWDRLLQKGYKDAEQNETINYDRAREGLIDILKEYGILETEIQVERRSCKLIMAFNDDVEELDNVDINDVLYVLAAEVIRPLCSDKITFETTLDEIPECVVYLWIDDYLSDEALEHTIEYK